MRVREWGWGERPLYWAPAGEAEEEQMAQWRSLREGWLDRWSHSPHTRNAFGGAVEDFESFIARRRRIIPPWWCTREQVEAWRRRLDAAGMDEAQIQNRLTGCRSWFNYALSHLRQDPHLARALNPFGEGTVEAGPPLDQIRARPLAFQDLQRVLVLLNRRRSGRCGARNYALLLTLLLSGRHPRAVLQMRLEHLHPDEKNGEVLVTWPDEPPERRRAILPYRAYSAIHLYLLRDGRDPDAAKASGFIWTPLFVDNVHKLVPGYDSSKRTEKPISLQSLRLTLTSTQRAAGVPACRRATPNDLRYTFTLHRYEAGQPMQNLRANLGFADLPLAANFAREVCFEDTDRSQTFVVTTFT